MWVQMNVGETAGLSSRIVTSSGFDNGIRLIADSY